MQHTHRHGRRKKMHKILFGKSLGWRKFVNKLGIWYGEKGMHSGFGGETHSKETT